MSIVYENKNYKCFCRNSHKLTSRSHLHSHVEIVYYKEGKTSAWVDDVEYQIVPGDIFITFPNQVHRYVSTDYEDYQILILSLELCSDFNPWFENFVPRSNVIHQGSYDVEKIENLIALIRPFESRKLSEIETIELKGYSLVLLSKIFEALEFVEEKIAEISVIKQLLNYCADHYTQDLSLDLLEKELHINKFYISHLFSKKLKIKFNDYINSLRILHACKLLQETNLNMTDIVLESGFATTRTFNRAFLKSRKETPSQYRKRCKSLEAKKG